jgi:hypothetical protein
VLQRARFATARDVFETYPSAAEDVRVQPTDEEPFAFAQALVRGATPEDALSFCAYVLPRREAVWWSCQCVRLLAKELSAADMAAIQAAEEWVREPGDEKRLKTMTIGMQADRNSAATWVALAAAWSGGRMFVGENAVLAAPHLTPRAVRIAVLTALARVGAKERARQIQACLNGAVRLGTEPSPT